MGLDSPNVVYKPLSGTDSLEDGNINTCCPEGGRELELGAFKPG